MSSEYDKSVVSRKGLRGRANSHICLVFESLVRLDFSEAIHALECFDAMRYSESGMSVDDFETLTALRMLVSQFGVSRPVLYGGLT